MSLRRLVVTVGIAAAMLGAAPVTASEPGRFERLFAHYNSIRLQLARDSLEDVAYHAERLGLLAGELAREARRAPGARGRAEEAQLRAIADAARKVQFATDLAGARAAFATLSRALLEYRGESGVEDPVVVFCPLHNTVWLQRSGDDIRNPYMGADRARCGEVLELRRPRWAPTRPSRLSPSEGAPREGGR